MDLAAIRKKAQQEKREPDAPVAGEFRSPETPPAPSLPPAEKGPSAVGRPADGPVPFDPLSIILAGRERAGWSEELSGGAEAEEEALREYLSFRVAGEEYAVNIMEMKEIIKPRPTTEVPGSPPFISGVLSLRGVIIPVFRMRSRLGHPEGEKGAGERIVVVKSGEGFCGLAVDEVVGVVRVGQGGIEHPPAVLEGIDREFVAGIGRYEGRMLILLNLEKILDVHLL